MRKYLLVLCMAVAAVAFTACQEDDETIYDHIVGRTWTGNLGFMDGPYQLESGLKLDPDGFGTDEQCYYDNGKLFGTFRLQWYLEFGNIYLNYGTRGPKLELRDVYVSRGTLSAELYIEGRYYDRVELQMYY